METAVRVTELVKLSLRSVGADDLPNFVLGSAVGTLALSEGATVTVCIPGIFALHIFVAKRRQDKGKSVSNNTPFWAPTCWMDSLYLARLYHSAAVFKRLYASM